MVLGLVAFWLRVSPFPRGCPAAMSGTAWAWRVGRALPTACHPIASAWKLGRGSPVPLQLGLGLLLIGSVALPALAYASLPDPLWIPGVYDDADYDDVVTLATSAAGDIAPVLPADIGTDPPLVGSVPHLAQTDPRVPAPSAVRSRAPPAS